MSFPSGSATGTSSTEVRDDGDAYSLIDAHSSLDGSLSTRRDLLVEGNVTGTLRCEGTLYIAEGATVDAEIDAAGIVVSGSMSGSIRCRGLLEIRTTGIVRGQVETSRLTILEGAVYEGNIRMQPGQEPARIEAPQPQEAGEPEEPATPSTTSTSYSFLRSFSGSGSTETPASDDLPGAEPPEEPES